MSTTEPGFVIRGEFYPLPLAGFTIGEARVIERITGLPIGEFEEQLAQLELLGGRRTSAGLIGALVWVAMHRKNPAVTPEVVDELRFDELAGIADEAAEANGGPPAQAASAPASAPEQSDAAPAAPEQSFSETASGSPA